MIAGGMRERVGPFSWLFSPDSHVDAKDSLNFYKEHTWGLPVTC